LLGFLPGACPTVPFVDGKELPFGLVGLIVPDPLEGAVPPAAPPPPPPWASARPPVRSKIAIVEHTRFIM
jgi:hypothetical protein